MAGITGSVPLVGLFVLVNCQPTKIKVRKAILIIAVRVIKKVLEDFFP